MTKKKQEQEQRDRERERVSLCGCVGGYLWGIFDGICKFGRERAMGFRSGGNGVGSDAGEERR